MKQCFGIDVSKDVFDVTLGTYRIDQAVAFIETKQFKNHLKGFAQFQKWATKRALKEIPAVYVMEATGVYHEKLACFLADGGHQVSVVLPNRASTYAKSLEVKTITDREASRSLCRMGLEKKMATWSKPDPVFVMLKQLTREREQLQKSKTICMNQRHAEKQSAWPNQESLRRVEKRLKLLKVQILEIERQIAEFIESRPDLNRKIGQLTSIPGVGMLTAATIVGETNGFQTIENKRQLVSYCGYDVIRKDSGTSVHSKPRISKRGNRHVRKAMHYPALTAIRHNDQDKVKFVRMVQKHGIKMKAAVAIQRKLLVTMFALWKNDSRYDPEFLDKKIGQLALP